MPVLTSINEDDLSQSSREDRDTQFGLRVVVVLVHFLYIQHESNECIMSLDPKAFVVGPSS